jgi:hypothetical protein
MPIIAVSRWQIDPEQARQLVREGAPLLRQHGAQNVTIGMIRTGNHVGQTVVAVTFASHEAFGRSQEALHNDSNYQKIMDQAMQKGQLQDRTILTIEEVQ